MPSAVWAQEGVSDLPGDDRSCGNPESLRDFRPFHCYSFVMIKTISLVAICGGILSILIAVVETLIQVYLLHIHPLDLIIMAQGLFLLAVAAMCYDRFYCAPSARK